MTLILHIETATKMCSAALARNGKLISIKETSDDKSHASKLTVFIDKLLTENSISAKNIDAIAVSKGPGSYTGLRIGVSAAKGLTFALDKPLIAINTLQTMAWGVENIETDKIQLNLDEDIIFCPMIDARRMEVYSAFYTKGNQLIRDIQADIIDENSYAEILNKRKIVFFGDGSEKCKNMLKHPNAFFIDNILPSSKYMVELAFQMYENKQFENTAYFEPFYLKDFVPTTPKNSVLNQ